VLNVRAVLRRVWEFIADPYLTVGVIVAALLLYLAGREPWRGWE
jgi:hypothetical protein